MNSLLTPNEFIKYKPLTMEEKVNIMFGSWKSTLTPLFISNNLYNSTKDSYFTEHSIFKNEWFKESSRGCETGGKEYARCNNSIKEENKDSIIEGLKLSQAWHSYNIFNAKNYEKIGFWFDIYLHDYTQPNTYHLIKFIKDVYCSDEEIYKKNDIILFDNLNNLVRITTDEEIKYIIENKKKF